MPDRSNAQRKFLFAKHPEIAKEFAEHTPKGKKLPEHVGHMREAAKRLKSKYEKKGR